MLSGNFGINFSQEADSGFTNMIFSQASSVGEFGSSVTSNITTLNHDGLSFFKGAYNNNTSGDKTNDFFGDNNG